MRVLPGVAEAVLVAAEEARLDRAERSVDIVAAADQLRGAQAVLGVLFDEAAGVEDRHDQRAGGVRVGVDEGAGSAEDLFRWSGQIAWLVAMVKPWPWSTARAPQGPPAQNPSMRPAWRWPTICAGGTTTLCTSCSGCRPMLASQ